MRTLQDIRTIGVCGIGTMGSAGVVCFQRAGFNVLAWGRDRAKLERLPAELNRMRAFADTHQGPAPRLGEVRLCPELERLDAEADVVFECISEKMDQKAELLRRLTAARDRGALFLSTTSGLSVTEMGRRSGLEHLLVGAHFWNPPHLMPLVEMIRGQNTPPDVFETACGLIEAAGKTVVRVEKDVPGFIGNRLQHAMLREAVRLVQDGVATAEDVDMVMKLTVALRLPVVGPLESIDLVGLDLVNDIQNYLLADLADDRQSPRAVRDLIAAGKLGVKAGHGFYDWKRRDAAELIRRRDAHILLELAAMRERAEKDAQ